MILNYEKFYNKYYQSYEALEYDKANYILNEINIRKERKKQKQKLIEELNYENNLITNDIIAIIKNDLNYSEYNLFKGYDTEMFSKTWKYINLKKDTNEETKKEYKKSFDFVTKIINKNILLNNNDFKLKEIHDYNYTQGYEFIYTYKGHKFSIYIPMFYTTNEKNYEQMLIGYRISHYESKSTSMLIIHNIDYRKVASDFEQWLKDNLKEDLI